MDSPVIRAIRPERSPKKFGDAIATIFRARITVLFNARCCDCVNSTVC